MMRRVFGVWRYYNSRLSKWVNLHFWHSNCKYIRRTIGNYTYKSYILSSSPSNEVDATQNRSLVSLCVRVCACVSYRSCVSASVSILEQDQRKRYVQNHDRRWPGRPPCARHLPHGQRRVRHVPERTRPRRYATTDTQVANRKSQTVLMLVCGLCVCAGIAELATMLDRERALLPAEAKVLVTLNGDFLSGSEVGERHKGYMLHCETSIIITTSVY